MLFHFHHNVMNVQEFSSDGVVFERHGIENFDEAMVILDHLSEARLHDSLTLLEIAERSARFIGRKGDRERSHIRVRRGRGQQKSKKAAGTRERKFRKERENK